MHTSSPYFWFDPESPGSLLRRHHDNLEPSQPRDYITKDDVIRVMEANPDWFQYPVLREYVLKALKDHLPRRKGRPRLGVKQEFDVYFAQRRIDITTRWLKRAERLKLPYALKTGRAQGSIREQVANEVARKAGIGTGGNLANITSGYRQENARLAQRVQPDVIHRKLPCLEPLRPA